MAEQYDDEGNVIDDNQQPDPIKELRAAAKRGETAAKELAAIKLELAATKAGINADTPLAKALLPTFQGDMTAEALTKFFKDLGADVFTKPADASDSTTTDASTQDQDNVNTPDGPDLTPEEIALQHARRGLSAGAVSDDGQDVIDPKVAGLNKFHDAMAKGEDRRTASGAFFEEVFAAAGRGDARVLK